MKTNTYIIQTNYNSLAGPIIYGTNEISFTIVKHDFKRIVTQYGLQKPEVNNYINNYKITIKHLIMLSTKSVVRNS